MKPSTITRRSLLNTPNMGFLSQPPALRASRGRLDDGASRDDRCDGTVDERADTNRLARLSYVNVEMAPVPLSAMGMLLMFKFDRNSNKASVTDAALADNMPGETPDFVHRAPQHRYLHAAVVIKVDMYCRHRQVMVLVKGPGQALRQCTLLMIVYIDECGHA